MSVTTQLKVKSRKNLTDGNESHRLPPTATTNSVTKSNARNNSQPTGRKIFPRRHESTAVTPVVTAADTDAVSKGRTTSTFTVARKKFFRGCLRTWRQLRRTARPRAHFRRHARPTLKFLVKSAQARPALSSARSKVLTFPRRRSTSLVWITRASLHRQLRARAPSMARGRLLPDTKRLRMHAWSRCLSRLFPRRLQSATRRFQSVARYRQLKRLRAMLPLKRRAQNALYRALNNTVRVVRAVLPAARTREHYARRGLELRERLFVPRRSRTRLQYSNLYGRYAAHRGAVLRRRLVRHLCAKRLCKKGGPFFRRMRRPRALSVRVARLRKANSRVRQTAQLLRGAAHRALTPQRESLWGGKVRGDRGRPFTLGSAVRHLKNFSFMLRKALETSASARSRRFLRVNRYFGRKLRRRCKLFPVAGWSTKVGLRRLLLVSRRLRRRQHLPLATLAPVNSSSFSSCFADTRYAATSLPRGSKRRNYFSRIRARSKRLRFTREGATSMLFARLQPYYHSRVLGAKDDCLSKGKSLHALDASIVRYQAAFADGQQLTKITTCFPAGRCRLRVPAQRAGRLRALFRTYTEFRLSRAGRKRSPRLHLNRRIVAARMHRFVRIYRRATVATFRLEHYQRLSKQLLRRDTSTRLHKTVATGGLARALCLQFVKRWQQLNGVARSVAKRRRDFYAFSRGRVPNWKRKFRRRWYNPRFKGKWSNYRDPAWLIAQNKQQPRWIEVKVPSVVSKLPALSVVSSRFAWLLTKKRTVPTAAFSGRLGAAVTAPKGLSISGVPNGTAVHTLFQLSKVAKSKSFTSATARNAEKRPFTIGPLAGVFHPSVERPIKGGGALLKGRVGSRRKGPL